MTKTRNISDLLDANGDVKSGALDNVPASNDASALTTGTLPSARLGTVTNFTSTGIDDNATSTAITIDSSERVGIGTTSPSSYYANHLVVDIGSTAQSGITIVADSSNQAMLAFADGTSGDTRYRGYLDYNHSNDSLAFASAGTERMRITSSGNVGIGTSSPNRLLTLGGTSNARLALNSSSYRNYSLSSDAYGFSIYDDTSTDYRLTVNNVGNVGIGTTSPNAELHISKSADGGNTEVILENSFNASGSTDETIQLQSRFGGYDASYIITGKEEDFTTSANRSSFMSFTTRKDGTLAEKMRIDSSGNVGIGTSSPDYSLEVAGTGLFGGSVMATGSTTTTASRRAIMTHDGSSMKLMASGDSTHRNIIFYRDGGSDEAMRINTSNLVGIGTSSPSEKLDVNGTVKATAFQGDGSALTGVSAGVAGISSSADATAITIDSSERVGIGTTSPGAMLEVGTDVLIDSSSGFYGNRLTIGSPNPNQTSNGGYGFGFHNSGAFFWTMSDTNSYWNTTNPNGYHYINFRSKGSSCGSIIMQSSSTSFNTSSDYRLKENVSYDFDATTRLKQLKPARFNFIADADKTVDGFLAHEVSSVVPEAIHGTKDAVDADGNPDYQGIDQSKLVPLLVKTIQELEARITTLEANNP